MKNYLAASVRGYAHEKCGIPNQDAFVIKHLYDFDVLMVLDGVSLDRRGQTSKSELASNYVKLHALKYIKKHATYKMSIDELENLIQKCFEACLKDLKRMALIYGRKYHASTSYLDYQTTLTLVIHRDGDIAYGNAGDSGFLIMTKHGLKQFSNSLKDYQYGSGVEPLCVKEAWRFGKCIHQDIKYLCLATDGIFDVLVPLKDGRHYNLAFMNSLLDQASIHDSNELKQCLATLSKKLTQDDKTIVILKNEPYRKFKLEKDEEAKRLERFQTELNALLNAEM